MPEMTIHLRVNPENGKKDIIITMRSDEDALPHEHEQQHKQMVEKLFEKGILKPGEEGDLIVEREEEEKVPSIPAGSEPQAERQDQQQGG